MTRLILSLAPILFISFATSVSAQKDARSEAYEAFDVFLGAPWEIDAFFLDGKKLEQKFEITRAVEGQIYKSTTWQKNAEGAYQLKSEGVRAWDERSRSFRFWEWGIDGSMVAGSIVVDGKNITYVYEFGDEIVSDVYSFERDGVFEYIIGVKDGDRWGSIYANGGVTRRD